MARSSRSSALKTNNQKLKKHVFGPVEEARNKRLSAKLLEIASQPKPEKDVAMEPVSEDPVVETKDAASATKEETMEVDSAAEPAAAQPLGKKRVEKRRGSKSSIVFRKYGEKKITRKTK